MSTTKSLLGDYSQAVSQFQAASQGSYAGPSTPLDLLGSMIGSVDGIKPQELVRGTSAAMGGRRPARGGGGLKGFLVGTVLSIAGNALMDHLGGVQKDFEQERDEADELTGKAQQCSNAIEDIVGVSDTSLTELFSAVVPLLNILTMIASKHPLGRFIVPIISSIGANVIEQTNDMVMTTCRDRDSAIEQCYDKFEECCSKVCERELPKTPPEPARGCEPPLADAPCPSAPPTVTGQPPADTTQPAQTPPAEACEATAPPTKAAPICTTPAGVPPAPPNPAPNPAPSPVPPTAPPTVPSVAPPVATPPPQSPVCPPPAAPVEQPCTQPAQAPVALEPIQPAQTPCPEEQPRQVTVQQDTEVQHDAETKQETAEREQEIVECEQETTRVAQQCPPEQSCCGCLGALGVGIAIIGVGLLAAAAAECLENMPIPEEPCPEPPPAPEPPAPEPPAPEPCPPPAPEPPAPEPPQDGVIPPPPELAEVEEPTPPPEKVAHMQAAGAPAPPPPSEPAPAPESGPAPEATQAPAPPAPEPAPVPEDKTVHARKAGQW